MLPRFYKFICLNNSNITVTHPGSGTRVFLKQWVWIVDPSTGKITYTQIADDNFGFTTGTILDGAFVLGSEIDNTSGLYVGMRVQLSVDHDAGATAGGYFRLFVATGDATGELESDASGFNTAAANRLQLVTQFPWNGGNAEILLSPMAEVT